MEYVIIFPHVYEKTDTGWSKTAVDLNVFLRTRGESYIWVILATEWDSKSLVRLAFDHPKVKEYINKLEAHNAATDIQRIFRGRMGRRQKPVFHTQHVNKEQYMIDFIKKINKKWEKKKSYDKKRIEEFFKKYKKYADMKEEEKAKRDDLIKKIRKLKGNKWSEFFRNNIRTTDKLKEILEDSKDNKQNPKAKAIAKPKTKPKAKAKPKLSENLNSL